MTKFDNFIFAKSNFRRSIPVPPNSYREGKLHLIILPDDELLALFYEDQMKWSTKISNSMDMDKICWGPSDMEPNDEEIHILIPLKEHYRPIIIP